MKPRNLPSFPKAGGGGTVSNYKAPGMYKARRNNSPVLQVHIPIPPTARPVQGKFTTDASN